MARTRKPSGRTPNPKAAARREILIFTEGEGTEPSYLNSWRRAHRDELTVVIDERHGAPKTLVELASSVQDAMRRAKRKGTGRAYDEVWCVFDVDEHDIEWALSHAAGRGIGIGLSNPCIELWFLLHFQEQTGFIDRRAAQRLATEVLGCEKRLTEDACQQLLERYAVARERAQMLESKHKGDGSLPGANPSSSLWVLLDRFFS